MPCKHSAKQCQIPNQPLGDVLASSEPRAGSPLSGHVAGVTPEQFVEVCQNVENSGERQPPLGLLAPQF